MKSGRGGKVDMRLARLDNLGCPKVAVGRLGYAMDVKLELED